MLDDIVHRFFYKQYYPWLTTLNFSLPSSRPMESGMVHIRTKEIASSLKTPFVALYLVWKICQGL